MDSEPRSWPPAWQQLEALAGLYDPRQLRNWWLADMRHLTSEVLKSPAFLALMKLNLALLTQPSLSQPARFFSWLSRR